MSQKLNHEMVILAREFRGLTQKELAEGIDVKQPQVAKLEAGVVGDSANDLLPALARVLDFPEEFFTLQETLVSFGSSSLYYRKKNKLQSSHRRRIHSLVNLMRINLKLMLNAVELAPVRQVPKMPIEENAQSPAAIARAVRAFWKLPDGPIKNMTALLESAGVLVVPCDFKTRDMDGTGLWLNDMPPTIFINRDLPGDRWRFTLCHELAHFVMHDVPHETMEDEADDFAAEMLAPEVAMRSEFARIGTIKLTQLVALKPVWKISIATLIKRAKDLGFISQYAAKKLWMERANAGGNNEPVSIEREKIQNLPNMLGYFRSSLNFSVTDMKGLLKLNPSELKSLYGVSDEVAQPRVRLRLV
jgi:Zn-dependent peptidase ImmA (M78 family)/transcriptional regulator with XRE-family HTH domain